jgi:hypothetical protein
MLIFSPLHFIIIKTNYCEAKKVKPLALQVVKALNANLLGLQMCFFKFMKMHVAKAMVEPFDINIMIKLWVTINNNDLITQQLSEILKLVEIIMMSMLRFIEDEWTFSTCLHS